jgi:hypothetical protein
MDRRELNNCILYHPNPSVIRVWRDGFPDWTTAQEAFDVARKSPLESTTLKRPSEPSKSSKYQNFVAQNRRGEYPLEISYWVIGFLSNLFAIVVAAIAGAFTAGSYHPVGILVFLLLLWSFITLLSIWQSVGIWRTAQRRIAGRAAMGSLPTREAAAVLREFFS